MIMLMIILFGRDQIEMSEFILPKYQYRDVQGDAGDFQSYSVYHAHFFEDTNLHCNGRNANFRVSHQHSVYLLYDQVNHPRHR